MDESIVALQELLLRPVVLWVFLVVMVTAIANFVARRLLLQIEKRTENTHNIWDDALARSARKPAAWAIWVVGLRSAAEIISADTGSDLEDLIQPVFFVAVALLVAWFLSRFVRELEDAFVEKGADITTASAIGKLLRVSVYITTGLSVAQTLGFSISGVLAFGGIGGIAVGFAAKDLLANFFGGLVVYLDRPFAVGDWVRSPDREMEGTVEHIGWRQTVIRTFDRRPLYVPNSVFTTVALENPSRMQNRRIFEAVGVRYDDASKVAKIVEDVRTMLEQHPDIDHDRTMIVNLNRFAASSLEFFVYTFTRTTNWIEFHTVKEKVMLEIIRIVESNGAEFAFPTQTLHIAGPEPEPEPE